MPVCLRVDARCLWAVRQRPRLHGDHRQLSLAPKSQPVHPSAGISSTPTEGHMRTTLNFIAVFAGAITMMPLLVQPTPLILWLAPV